MHSAFDIAWALLKTWEPSPQEIAEMEAGRQLGMDPEESVFAPEPDDPEAPLPHEDIGERQRGTVAIRPSQTDRARSEQAMTTQELRSHARSGEDAKLDAFMRRRAGKGRDMTGAPNMLD